jgi:hypothetical protein
MVALSFEINLNPAIFLILVYTGFKVSDFASMATVTFMLPPLLRKPNTKINISGNAILKTTAEGLLKIERKLALVMASIALI